MEPLDRRETLEPMETLEPLDRNGADGADGADGSKGASGHQSSPRRHLSWPGGPQRMTAPGWTDQQVWSCVRGLQKIAAGGFEPWSFGSPEFGSLVSDTFLLAGLTGV
ncbi:hypothetical protein THAOC_19651 [Thalassiosira oceanica]|uniref:Uncharacterized protein n=1 Tax=Thalassiosira oceanica TaxID=159749 RepID=K0S450_THAOC|nr:hypothetical protein THAOC_19651 [Thalassiosira oceanica]|eukprot:EJK60065.1 hypothetical protein THAOC_19651 [Thalassiosira oceanica]